MPLVLRHDHYAGDIVLLLAKLFLREGETDQVCQSSAEAGNLLHLPLSLSGAVRVRAHATHTKGDEFFPKKVPLFSEKWRQQTIIIFLSVNLSIHFGIFNHKNVR